MRDVFYYHLPAVLYGVAILAVSSVPNLKAPDVGTWPIDKLAHLVEYAGFAFLVQRSVSRFKGRSTPRSALWPVLYISAAWALVDECIQSLVPGRFADPADFLFDVLGGVLVVAILWFKGKRRGRSGA